MCSAKFNKEIDVLKLKDTIWPQREYFVLLLEGQAFGDVHRDGELIVMG